MAVVGLIPGLSRASCELCAGWTLFLKLLENSAVRPGAVFSGRFSLVPGFSAMSYHVVTFILHPFCTDWYLAVPNYPCLIPGGAPKMTAQHLADTKSSG